MFTPDSEPQVACILQGAPPVADAAGLPKALRDTLSGALDRLQQEAVPALSLLYNLVACLRVLLGSSTDPIPMLRHSSDPSPGPHLRTCPSPGARHFSEAAASAAAGPQLSGAARALCLWVARLLLTCADPDFHLAPSHAPLRLPEKSIAAAAPAATVAPAGPTGLGSGSGSGPADGLPKRRSGRGSTLVAAPASPAVQTLNHKPTPKGSAAPVPALPTPASPVNVASADSNPNLCPAFARPPDPPIVLNPPGLKRVAAVLEHFLATDGAFAALRSANRATRARPSRAESRRASLFTAPHGSGAAAALATGALPHAPSVLAAALPSPCPSPHPMPNQGIDTEACPIGRAEAGEGVAADMQSKGAEGVASQGLTESSRGCARVAIEADSAAGAVRLGRARAGCSPYEPLCEPLCEQQRGGHEQQEGVTETCLP